MTPAPLEFSSPKRTRPAWRRALCRLRLDGHDWRSVDVIQLSHTWLACTDKRCQRCGLWLIRGRTWL